MDTRRMVDTFLAALAAGDFGTIGPFLHPDFVVHEAPSLPYAGSFRGLDGWRELSRRVVRAWRDFRFELIEFHGSRDDALIMRFAISGQSRRSGKSFRTTVLELWRFRDGLLCEIVPYYWDTAELVAVDTP
jgi:ketosteroid isomerase-like protein